MVMTTMCCLIKHVVAMNVDVLCTLDKKGITVAFIFQMKFDALRNGTEVFLGIFSQRK